MEYKEITASDAEKILAKQQAFFDSQSTKDIDFRIQQLQILRNGISQYESKIEEALQLDLGKHPFEAYLTEIGFVLGSIDEMMKNVKEWAKPEKVNTPLIMCPAKGYIISEPYGSALIIGPYNYPFQLLIEPLIGAMTAGNCAVLKPSELAPHTAAVVTAMITEFFDPNYICAVEGSVDTNTALLALPFDYIFFTGSVAVGKIVMRAAAENLVPVTLELGGKSPVIVDESANLKVAAKRIIWGKTMNAGQTCVAPDYLMVHAAVKDALIAEMIAAIQEYFGTDSKESQSFGRIINARHFARIKGMIDHDREHILYGGNTDEVERYIEPTLIDADFEHPATMTEEIFGPVLPVLTYRDLNQAIKEIKRRPKPLALYLFTENEKNKEKVLQETSSGGACINDVIMHLANPNLPFGGVGSSGLGAYHGKTSFATFSHKKSILTKTTKINLPLTVPPYSNQMLKNLKFVMK